MGSLPLEPDSLAGITAESLNRGFHGESRLKEGTRSPSEPNQVHSYYSGLGRALCGGGVFAAVIVVFGRAAIYKQRRCAHV
jgi:hypothetical protein